jgi:biofilm PGA synthesis N-glycosyltransferase PgaC
MWVLARLLPRDVQRAAYQPHVALIIVVHNEAARIARKLDSCLALDYPKNKLRIVVVSDGSSDETNVKVAKYASRGVELLELPVRRGKAACLNDAIAGCGDEVVVLTDARQRLDARAICSLAANFADRSVGAVSGELVFDTDGMTGFGEGLDVYWRYEKFIRHQESRFHSVVGMTGALCALRREYFKEIPADTILDDVVIPMNVVMQGKRVVCDKHALAFDFPSRDPGQERRRKLRTLAGNYQLVFAHPEFFNPMRNPILFQLVSHKILRLVSPLCLAVLLATNVLLAATAFHYQALLAAQVLAYTLSAFGFASSPAREWRLVKVSTAFLLLNWFAVLGLVEFMRNRSPHLWDSHRSLDDSSRK